MRRWITRQDIVIFGGVPFIMTVLTIGALLTPQKWAVAGAIILGAVNLLSWAIFGYLILKHWLRRPDFVTVMGTAVWTNGLSIKADAVADAINFYCANVSHRYPKPDMATMLSMFGRARIEFVEGPVLFGGHKYAGVQKGYSMRVRWLGGFGSNAFFHECHHMVDEVLLDRPVDYEHTRMDWWDMIPKLKHQWREGAKKAAP